nr:capsid protein [Rat picobirnavirus]
MAYNPKGGVFDPKRTQRSRVFKEEPKEFTKYSSSNLIAMNLATKLNQNLSWLRSDTIDGGEGTPSNYNIWLPMVAQVELQLSTPKGDLDGWQSGIRLLWQQLRTANSGRINYGPSDLEKYVINTRALHSICAFLTRLYRMTYTFTSVNSDIPYAAIAAMYLNPQDIIRNAGNLFTYVQRYSQEVRANFPLDIGLFRRTWALFSNVFADSDQNKAQWYIPVMAATYQGATGYAAENGIYYYTSSSTDAANNTWQVDHVWYLTTETQDSNRVLDYRQMTEEFDLIKNALLDDPLTTIIAGDIIKAFGDAAFFDMDVPEIDQAIRPVYDERMLTQIENGMFLNYTDADPNQMAVTAAEVSYSETVDDDGWIVSAVSSSINNDAAEGTLDYDIRDVVIQRANYQVINWHSDKIQPGEVMQTTRLCPTHAYLTEARDRIAYNTYGTEIPSRVRVYYQYSVTSDGDTAQPTFFAGEYRKMPISGVVVAGGGVSNFEMMMAYNATAMWSFFDHAPKLAIATGRNTSGDADISTISAALFDYDTFAYVGADRLREYFSYGNQSLLLAAASQNQAGTKDYKHGTVKRYGKGNNKRKDTDEKPDASNAT